jgi:hypothetical protein
MQSKFDNKDRSRYYGLRIGDIVKAESLNPNELYTIIDYGKDNNRVIIQSKDGKIIEWVAEWCEIITPILD